MKTIVCNKPGDIQLMKGIMPSKKNGFSILRVKCVGVCGTDIHAYLGDQPYFTYPRILGHELAAEVVETGCTGFKKGDQVTIIPYFPCGACLACRKGNSNCCSDLRVFGIHVDGGMSDYIQVPDFSLISGQGLTNEQLAVVEPFAIAAHGIGRAALIQQESVLIVGAGPIGIAVALLAVLKGGIVTIMDTNEDRLNYCHEVLGIRQCINVLSENVLDEVLKYTNGDLASVVIDATGNQFAINNSFKYLAHTGRYVLIGLQKKDICFNHPEFHKREASLLSSRNATRKDFEEVIAYLKSGLIDVNEFITHRLPANRFEREFKLLLTPYSKVLKAVVVF